MDDHLEADIRQLQDEIARLQLRLGSVEAQLRRMQAPAEAPARPSPEPPAPPVLLPAPPAAPQAAQAPEAPAAEAGAAEAGERLRETLEEVIGAPGGREAPPAAGEAEAAGKPKLSLEQRVGVNWLSRVGVLVLLLGAVFFFQYAIQQGWIRPIVRVLCGVAAGAVLLGLGEWTRRKGWRIFAAAMTGGGIGLLYLSVYAAGPKWYELIETPAAFALMCAVTIVGVAVSLRSGMISSAVLAQIGAYLTPILLGRGRNEQVILMTYLLAVAGGFLVVAAVRRWQALGPLALAGTAAVFGLWYGRHYDAGQWLSTDAFAWGLAAVFVGYAALAAARRRAGDLLAASVAALAGLGMMVLWACQIEDLPLGRLMPQLLALDAALLAVAVWRRWGELALVWLAGTAILFGLWCAGHYDAVAWPAASAYAWALFGLFAACAVAGTALKRTAREIGIALLSAAGGLAVLAWLRMAGDMSDTQFLGHLAVLDAIVLAACLGRRWHWLRAGALGWTALALLIVHQLVREGVASRGLWAAWGWVFFALFTADVLIRAWWRSRQTDERLDTALAAAATAMMFAATYRLLRVDWRPWMGAYTAALAAGAIGLAWPLRRSARRRTLAYAYLAQGLVLITLAMPIQFDKSTLTVSWAAQAVVTMFLASRLRSRLLLAKSPVVLALAVGHFFAIDVPTDPRLAATMLTVGGVAIRWLLVLAGGLTAAALGAAAILRAGRRVRNDEEDRAIACTLVCGGAAIWLWQTAAELPAVAATWWWLALAAGLAGVGLWRRSGWLSAVAGVALAAAAAKFGAYDTLARRLGEVHEAGWPVVVNWQFLAGAALAAACLLYARIAGRRLPAGGLAGPLRVVASLVGAGLVLWAGSFEVDRYCAARPDRFDDLAQATQMGYSIFWAVYAAVLLAAGFLARRREIRYMSLVIFAVTLGKVLLVDMAGIELVYRIGSFLALGALLVAASMLYQRYFHRAVAEWDQAGE